MDKQNGIIAFSTGMSMWSWGQDVQLVIIDNADETYSIDISNSYHGLTDWGEGSRIGKRIVEAASQLLQRDGLSHAIR